MSVATRLANQRQLAEKYGFVATPHDDILQFRLSNNDRVFHVWYTTYSRGKTPWAVASVKPIPKGEKGEGQDQYSDHQYFAELEDAFIYASGETLDVEEPSVDSSRSYSSSQLLD